MKAALGQTTKKTLFSIAACALVKLSAPSRMRHFVGEFITSSRLLEANSCGTSERMHRCATYFSSVT